MLRLCHQCLSTFGRHLPGGEEARQERFSLAEPTVLVHRHVGDEVQEYRFRSAEQLLADFGRDVEEMLE